MNGLQLHRVGLGVAALGGGLGMALLPPAEAAQGVHPPFVLAQTESLEERANQFIDLIFAEQYDAALVYLHPLLRADTEGTLADRTEAFLATTGAFQGRGESQTVENVVFVTTEFTEVTDTIVLIFDESGLVIGLDFPVEPLRTIP